jgi:polyferredoxin
VTRFGGVFLPREDALLVVVPGLRADAVLVPFFAVPAPVLLDDLAPDFLAGVAFFLVAAFLGGGVSWAASVPFAFHASAIITAKAAQLRIFLIGYFGYFNNFKTKKGGRNQSGRPGSSASI